MMPIAIRPASCRIWNRRFCFPFFSFILADMFFFFFFHYSFPSFFPFFSCLVFWPLIAAFYCFLSSRLLELSDSIAIDLTIKESVRKRNFNLILNFLCVHLRVSLPIASYSYKTICYEVLVNENPFDGRSIQSSGYRQIQPLVFI